MSKVSYIYKTTNLITGLIYIGQRTFEGKILKDSYLGSGVVFLKSINKHGIENFSKEILEIVSREELNEREIFWIKFYNSTNEKVGYNISKGGGILPFNPLEHLSNKDEIILNRNKSIKKALLGVPHSEIRNSQKSKNWHSQEKKTCKFCLKELQKSLINRHETVCLLNPNRIPFKHSEETKIKIGVSGTGKVRTGESKLKMKGRVAPRTICNFCKKSVSNNHFKNHINKCQDNQLDV